MRLLEQHTETDNEHFARLNEELEKCSKAIAQLDRDLARYKNFVSGVAFIVGILVTIFSTFTHELIIRLFGWR